jgi:hypothetical protein
LDVIQEISKIDIGKITQILNSPDRIEVLAGVMEDITALHGLVDYEMSGLTSSLKR